MLLCPVTPLKQRLRYAMILSLVHTEYNVQAPYHHIKSIHNFDCFYGVSANTLAFYDGCARFAVMPLSR